MADVLDTPAMQVVFRIMMQARAIHDNRFEEHKAKFFWRETLRESRNAANRFEVCRYGDYPEPSIIVLEGLPTMNAARRCMGRLAKTYVDESAIRDGLRAVVDAGFAITMMKEQQNE